MGPRCGDSLTLNSPRTLKLAEIHKSSVIKNYPRSANCLHFHRAVRTRTHNSQQLPADCAIAMRLAACCSSAPISTTSHSRADERASFTFSLVVGVKVIKGRQSPARCKFTSKQGSKSKYLYFSCASSRAVFCPLCLRLEISTCLLHNAKYYVIKKLYLNVSF